MKKVAWNGERGEEGAETPAADADENVTKPEQKPAPEPEEDSVVAGGNVIDLDAAPAPAAAAPSPPEAVEAPAAAAAAEEEAEEEEEEEPVAQPEPEAPSNDPLAAELRKRRAQARARAEAKKEKAPRKRKKKAKPEAAEETTVATYKGSDPCRAASFSVPRVREACAAGGRPAAKRVMKDAIGNATATGQLLKCSDCHANQRDYALKGDAVAELKRWLDTSSS